MANQRAKQFELSALISTGRPAAAQLAASEVHLDIPECKDAFRFG